MKSLILYFFLLILRFSLNLSPNASYKQDKFPKILLKKDFEFILNKRGNIILFDLNFILLLREIYLVIKKPNNKKNTFRTYSIGYVKIIFVLLTKTIAIYIWVFIVYIRITSLKGPVLESRLCLAIFLALTNDSKANLVAFYRSTSMYKPGKLE